MKINEAYCKAIRNQDFALEDHAQTCLLPALAQRQQIKNCPVLSSAYQDCPRTLPALQPPLGSCFREGLHDILKVLKIPTIEDTLPARLSFRIGGEIKNFSDKQNYSKGNTERFFSKFKISKNIQGRENYNWKINHLCQYKD